MVTRSGLYGRYLGMMVNYIVENQDEMEKEEYRQKVVEEIKEFDPKDSERELREIEKFEVEEPEDLAKVVKEGMHLMY